MVAQAGLCLSCCELCLILKTLFREKVKAGGGHFSMCLWTSKATFGFVEGTRKDNWGLSTQHKSIRLRKTTIFPELLLLQEGLVIFHVSGQTRTNLHLWEQWAWAAGLEDKIDIYTPQKVNNIPLMSSLSSCNTAGGYLQIVDCEGGVWSCGYNTYGQLGVDSVEGKKRQFKKAVWQKNVQINGKATKQRVDVENAIRKGNEAGEPEALLCKPASGKMNRHQVLTRCC